MSIATEIQRLQQAKSDLKTSIQAKGVTVSSEAKLDDYPDLVDSIQAGGDASAYKDWIEGNTDDIPDGVTKLRSYCFVGLNSIQPTISSSVTHLGSHCFYQFYYGYSTNNQSIIIPDTVTSVSDRCFDKICQNIARGMSITIKGVTALSEYMFNESQLQGFPIINPSITELPSGCFYGVKFKSDSNTSQVIQIPSHIKTIGGACFQSCEAKRIIVPDTVETIISTSYTFYTWRLPQLQFLSSIPPTITGGGITLINTSQTKIYVPDEAVDTYKSAEGFTTYASCIYPVSEMPS